MGVDDSPSGDVDQQRVRLHGVERIGVDQVQRLIRERTAEHDIITVREELVESVGGEVLVEVGVVGPSALGGEGSHAEDFGQSGAGFANAAVADNAQGLSGELDRFQRAPGAFGMVGGVGR